MSADGTNQVALTDPGQVDGVPSWSPDGSQLVFRSQRDGNEEIYVMNADGSGEIRLTDNEAADGNPRWSPSIVR